MNDILTAIAEHPWAFAGLVFGVAMIVSAWRSGR